MCVSGVECELNVNDDNSKDFESLNKNLPDELKLKKPETLVSRLYDLLDSYNDKELKEILFEQSFGNDNHEYPKFEFEFDGIEYEETDSNGCLCKSPLFEFKHANNDGASLSSLAGFGSYEDNLQGTFKRKPHKVLVSVRCNTKWTNNKYGVHIEDTDWINIPSITISLYSKELEERANEVKIKASKSYSPKTKWYSEYINDHFEFGIWGLRYIGEIKY